ncbi:unnamed protein product [Soboliphyme baturini]|uniref:Endo/exonuclease/phosphatase domain-containing protein n=1 Tax=Soboliphyme baturini TaxID=241478 RepID=A0A183IGF9_9BILA|nr:unnamed protein product [Soboliphyme baturini]
MQNMESIMLIGDFNAHVRVDAEKWNGVTRKNSPSDLNNNGMKLLQFCANNGLSIMNTFIEHRRGNQNTWAYERRQIAPHAGVFCAEHRPRSVQPCQVKTLLAVATTRRKHCHQSIDPQHPKHYRIFLEPQRDAFERVQRVVFDMTICSKQNQWGYAAN